MTDDAALPHPPAHGSCTLADVRIDGYSLEIEDEDGLVGDQASQTAFRELLAQWRERMERAGHDPLGPTPSEEMSKETLDRLALSGDTEAARTVALAINEFSERLAYVIGRLMKHPSWQGVQRIVVGGGFKESAIGRIAIRQTAGRLQAAGQAVQLRAIHYGADDGGLIGGIHLLDRSPAGPRASMLAIDIGGTNVRCGIVEFGGDGGRSALVVRREKWRHADEEGDADLVQGIVAMLRRLIAHAEGEQRPLLPVLAVGCPGVVLEDGSIDRGAQNLPDDWRQASFHLPRRLQENIPRVGEADTVVVMHNDAVVQGLSELPFTQDVARWAVLTIGTGLGNASYTNTPG
ncbi:ROK family protein [Aquincola tertiaricarbonis]|uniref:ROK family protein n=1 Tax=Aquincola tertiaricarbonis TaxID=391953 RepID=UPI00061527A6|nr:ROK family protein [Aquincola tertiaricarbonis]